MPDPENSKPSGGVAVFGYGFRPFFLMAGIYGMISPAAWTVAYLWGLPFPGTLAPSLWHAHEMLFGFTVAAGAGFLLTAVPSWTGTDAPKGAPLILLSALWLAGRAVLWMGDAVPPVITAVVDLAMIPALIVAIATPIVRSGKKRNLPILVLIGVVFIGNLLFHAEALGLSGDTAQLGIMLAIYAFVILIVIITGRIAPSFTANALKTTHPEIEVSTPRAAQLASLVSVLGTIAADLAGAPETVTGTLALAAALALIWRMSRWRTLRTRHSPILWVLHLAHAWVAVGFGCMAVAGLTGWLTATTALHALTAGAAGTAILAIMTRAGLGHTGRPMIAPPAIVASYFCITGAALLRVFGVASGTLYIPFVLGSALLWALAFALYTVVFAPILLSPRPDGKPG